jgi:transcriptional regulator with XRE-family HTH domain
MYKYQQRWYNGGMNEFQVLLAELRAKGWTLAAIADELGITRNAVDAWRSGARFPSNAVAVKRELERLLNRKRIPRRRRIKEKAPR